MKRYHTWKERLLDSPGSTVVDIPLKMKKRFGRGKMLMPAPLDVYRLLCRVDWGKLITPEIIREKLIMDFTKNGYTDQSDNLVLVDPLSNGMCIRICAWTSADHRQAPAPLRQDSVAF